MQQLRVCIAKDKLGKIHDDMLKVQLVRLEERKKDAEANQDVEHVEKTSGNEINDKDFGDGDNEDEFGSNESGMGLRRYLNLAICTVLSVTELPSAQGRR